MSFISKLFFWQNQQLQIQPLSLFLRQYNNFDVYVDSRPIGGSRAGIGALWINHKDHKSLMQMDVRDLKDLSKVTNKILRIFELNNVNHALLYGRQFANLSFELNFIPYPRCSFYEKIQSAIHLIFGSPRLSQRKIDEIGARLNNDALWNQPAQNLPNLVEADFDHDNPFRNNAILNNQRVKHIIPNHLHTIDILHDNRPKGPQIENPHFLIVPEGDLGGHDGSNVPIELRTSMFSQAQRIMRALRSENRFNTYAFIERTGSLRSVRHLHEHVIGLISFPQTFFQKIKALFRIIFPEKLSDNAMQERINHYAPLL